MKKRILIALVLVLLFLGYYAGPFQPLNFRDHQAGAIDTENKNARLMVIGLDDAGNLEDLAAIERVSQTIKDFRPKIVFFFVHGWRGDASKENELEGDLGRYRHFIDDTAAVFSAHPLLKRWKQERILGVYVAWHGHARAHLPLLSFWNRYDAASRIGENATIFPQLQSLFHDAHQNSTRKSPARVVLFAHSMGGRIVNGWLNQLADPLALHKEGKMPDLTLIINPAAPTKQYESFVDQYHQHHKKDRRTPPLIISITSQEDIATRLLYPIGTFETAIGHEHQTHSVTTAAPPDLVGYECTITIACVSNSS